MADLPPTLSSLFISAPILVRRHRLFWFDLKIGHKSDKRWGILFYCLTTQCIHIEILTSLNTDIFLMAFQRFITRCGQPFEIL